MAGVRYTWNDHAFDEVNERAWERLVRVGLRFQEECKKTVGVVNPPPCTPTDKGAPPRLRTGFGRDNILIEYDRPNFIVRVGVGVNAIYMLFQELSKRLNHPWLSKTLERVTGALKAIAEGK